VLAPHGAGEVVMSVRSQGRTVAVLAIAALSACARPTASGAGAGTSAGAAAGASPGAPVAARPAATLPSFPTPAPAPEGAVSEVRTIAGISPVQVMTTLGGRKGSGFASERDCGSGPTAGVQCADLVIARIPKTVASLPKVQVYAKKHASSAFVGPCHEVGDAVDCALVLGGTPGGSVRLVGRKPRLEVVDGSFSIRWRAMNLAAEDHDVKLVVSY
jgi:hypothetical protein